MFAAEREQLILNYLNEHELASTTILSEVTGASIATIRRDLNSMNQRGLLYKTHGGAQALKAGSANAQTRVSNHFDPYEKSKDRIARTASKVIQSGDIIFIGAGKTCSLLAKYIRDRENITVVTTNLDAVLELSNSTGISILLLGGDVHVGGNYLETLGGYTLDALNKLYFDKVFFTVNGADLEYGYSIVSRLQLPLYNHLMNNCKNCYLLIDASKFSKRTFTYLCDMDNIHNVVTETSIPRDYAQFYANHKIDVIIECDNTYS